ncbi:hypothetical protein DyAD56_02130 [Dyella sp. AD56]|uniref:hypothetical protein n=1 Tax=Dyella sp. AD56 TaxID=1528744 RepID=UPI000C86335C|nr:hypothetical protein [Dyella sp. AD56]PMQ07544.1 hypothetical protein DyAD56_02130 [Dyella sp. AD56]
MAWEERYGGIWNPSLGQGGAVLFERYLPDLDLVTVVVKRADGLLSASVLSKGHDPQWRLPFWSATEVPAIVETMADADRYFEAAICRE